MTRAVNRPFLRFDLFHHLRQVVGWRRLHRRELLEGFQVPQSDSLADRQEIPVVDVGGTGRSDRALYGGRRLLPFTDRLLEGITLDVVHQREVVVDQRVEPAIRARAGHRVVELPVLVAHGGERRARIVDERLAGRLVGLAGQIVDLIDAGQLRLDEVRILAGLDLLVQLVALGTAGDFGERRHPVEGREHFLVDRARLDVARPADDARHAITTFPSLALLALERRDAAIGVADRLGTVVGGEDDDRVVQFAHVFELLEDVTDVVVHLLHAGFVGTPVLAAL